jgi:outer membrane receptor for ferrienterochelin and colicin
MNRIVKILIVLVLPFALFAQNTITGTVSDAANGNGLAGANVVVGGTTMGAAADVDGYYAIENVPDGTYALTASVIGYENGNATITLPGEGNVDFALTASALELSALEVFASRATRNTPVAYADIAKEDMELRLASRDIPMILNTTPSVYATQQGGGAGDARINVRGFNQRNVAIMINGVPVNDMENGWVYWSNWDGVGDATSSIQMQRGLSAVNLATPSVGGTMNIITDPASFERGGLFKQEMGSGGFLKSTLSFNSGLIADKFAINGTIVKKTGDGIIDKTWTKAWAFYFGASYALTDNDRLELYAVGAPQRHGQNLYKQNIAVYDTEFAKGLDDYNQDALYENGGEFEEVDRYFNQNWSPVSSSYKGQQYWEMYLTRDGVDRYNPDLLNERENYFNKPQVNLNWYHTFSDALILASTFYFSGGKGGGTGTYGEIVTKDALGKSDIDPGFKYYYGPSPWVRDWDATIAINAGPAGDYYFQKSDISKANGQSIGILRNSVNQQWTIGAISKATYKVNENLKVIGGLDWRTAEIDHFRHVRDLLGGDYYDPRLDSDNSLSDFWSGGDFNRKLGDKIDYHNTNTVDWLGAFGQAEYSANKLSAYATAGYSTIKYTLTDHFLNDGGDPLFIEADAIGGYQLKGGGLYNLMDGIGVFANFGLISKVPIFDGVINDFDSELIDGPTNEEIISAEVGANFSLLDKKLTANLNIYNTNWNNRILTVTDYDVISDDEGLFILRDLDAIHRGVEMDFAYQPMNLFRLDGAVSIGDWKQTNDTPATYKDYGTRETDELTIYTKDLKIGDAPQTQVAIAASVFPIDGLQAQAVYKYYDNYYADYNISTRIDPDDRTQSWKIPSYGILDLHLSYILPFEIADAYKFKVFAHVFNALDETYIQDALDNSKYSGWDKDHDADDAEVFFGLPRFFNVGLSIER